MAISYVNGYFQFNLDGYDCGIVQKVSGGSVKAEVVKYAQSTEYLVKNHLGNITNEDIKVTCGLSMGKPLQEWIKASLDSAHVYKNGSIVVANYNREAVQELEWKTGLITEVGFPAADAAAKDAAYLSLGIGYETIRRKKGDGAKISKPANPKQTQFKAENFRFTLDGFDKVNAKVSKVDAMAIKQKVQRDAVGVTREHEFVPAALDMPILKITFAEAVVDDLAAYHEQFVVMGKNTVDQEKTFLLEFLDQARENVLLAIQGTGVGISNLTRSEWTNNDDKIATCTAEFYVDKIDITEWNA